MALEDLVVWKAVWELRYPPAASLFDLRGKIADQWYRTQQFDHWNIDRNQVLLHDEDKTSIFLIHYRRMVFAVERPNIANFCQKAANVSGWTAEILKIRQVERIGFRLYLGFERDSFEIVYNAMLKKLFKLDDHDWEVFGGRPRDIGFPITLELGDKKANFRMGPTTKSQLADILESNIYKNELPEAAFLIDFDIFQDNPSFRRRNHKADISTFLQDSAKIIEGMSNNIMNHFEGFKDG